MPSGGRILVGLGALAVLAAGAPAVAETPAGVLFVAGKRGNTLSKIDLATGEERLRVPSCTNPHELAAAPDGNHVALACYGGTSVDIFAVDTLEKVASIDLGANARPHGIVWQQDEGTGRDTIFVTAEGRGAIFAIDYPLGGEPDLTEIPTGKVGSHMLAVSPDGAFAWTMDMGSGTVTLIEVGDARALRSAAVGTEPEGIALSPDGQTLWVSARGSNRAFALDPMTLAIREEVATGRFPLRIAVRPQGDVAVTSELQDGSLGVIDTATAKLVRTIPVSGPAEAAARQQVTILWSKDGARIYVAETGSDTVAEVDYARGTVTRRLRAGEGGDGMAILP
ncbi:YncE family protein [Erythrobacter sp. NE805]|uniref:YncE family protein n=1 Tax=Erythrobacter sp. NE805 TaxID=3389875 RepID=UPI00396B3C38